MTITGATFALYEADAEWNKTSENPFNTEDIVSGNEGRIELKDLPVGNYLLVETKAALVIHFLLSRGRSQLEAVEL